ncbi:imidazoleglycerol-phosphate dehydratase 2, chloroplastic isoform X3 [Macadamia integrifolia]|uniref:imidazoleglycerol-phosphate dehydratase 2, chloroplastic isoform X3 n=1 Tax=Macadamia integrifolia TaxID=60698 RepID=UPI001C4FDA29|nr:imidazoleglycerol-phosphate dehydratase 2, chloroplastic isoform X3 [Macadamia integrifolia]
MELLSHSALLRCPSSQALKSRVRFGDFSAIVLPKSLQFSTHPQKLRFMEAQRTVSCAAGAGENGLPVTKIPETVGRIGEVKRVTKETNVFVKLNLDGSGIADSSTSIPFLDHMLDQLASHGLFDVHVRATGDIHIDDHHTNEDVALAIGTSLLQALGDRKGINRFGDFSAPLDEALIHVSLLVEHFFQSVVNTSGMTLHIRQLAGKNSHHIIEATFKAFARALRQATEYDPRRRSSVPSSKGVLSRS